MALNIKRIQPWLTAAQTIAVILGVGFATVELVFKDREANRQRYATTLEVASQDNSADFQDTRKRIAALISKTFSPPPAEGDAEYRPLVKELDALKIGVRLLDEHYARLLYCAENGLCDQALLQTLVCSEVRGTRLQLAMIANWLNKADGMTAFALTAHAYSLRPGWMLEHFNQLCAIPTHWVPSRRDIHLNEKRYGPSKDLLDWPMNSPSRKLDTPEETAGDPATPPKAGQ